MEPTLWELIQWYSDAKVEMDRCKKLIDEYDQKHFRPAPPKGQHSLAISYPSTQKIPAIKLIREWTGLGLAEAKKAADIYFLDGLTLPVKEGLENALAKLQLNKPIPF
jgi:ribosomal protein L7/L12